MKLLVLIFVSIFAVNLFAAQNCTVKSEFSGFNRDITKGNPAPTIDPIDGVKLVSVADAIKYQKSPDKYVFVDVRPISFYNQCHIKNAESRSFVPKKILASDDIELKKEYLQTLVKEGKTIVFYCQGKKCYLSANSSIAACQWGIPKKNIKWFRDGISALQRKKRRAVTGKDCNF